MTLQRYETGPRMSKAVSYNGTVFLSGLTTSDTTLGTEDQTTNILAEIDRLLTLAGTDKTRLLTAQIWLRDIADFDKMNRAWEAWVAAGATPVRATTESRLANPAFLVEIQVSAALA